MITILMYVANGLIILSFLVYFILIILNNKKIITNSDGFNVTKDILSDYDNINIIENSENFTTYNLKRKIIKIAKNNYYGSSLTNITIPLLEAGISAIDNKNKYLSIIKKITSSIKYLYILSITSTIINAITKNISDAKASIVFITIFAIISYFLISIKTEAIIWIDNNIKKLKTISKENQTKIIEYLNAILTFDKVIFISELIMIIRFVMIIIFAN